jgi:hypothetical protein
VFLSLSVGQVTSGNYQERAEFKKGTVFFLFLLAPINAWFCHLFAKISCLNGAFFYQSGARLSKRQMGS